ncbi:Uncharacterised protein [Legionella beliardensis]|uniref:Uncharacterized protein n=1 Tax=Legionella beliardensis TaxID=91822 RepID=A0A378HY47_9GAMM|nr:hypothetical protein [Legionella beliardensis]STX27623.1 Uncharacterised protein [Legionella beliardensis]
MEQLHDSDLIKLKELLRHAGEFIAYFEVAESKMIAWRQELETHSQIQEKKINHQLQNLQQELEALQEVLTQAGIARLRLSLEQALKDGEEHIALLQKTGQTILNDIQIQQQEVNKIIAAGLNHMEQYTVQALTRINNQLADYDVDHFRRVASESCMQVEKVATVTMRKSANLLKAFQWRSIALALVTTFLTAFAISLYVSSETPWESHQHALNERQAGRALMKIWPQLSHQEKDKILTGYIQQKS